MPSRIPGMNEKSTRSAMNNRASGVMKKMPKMRMKPGWSASRQSAVAHRESSSFEPAMRSLSLTCNILVFSADSSVQIANPTRKIVPHAHLERTVMKEHLLVHSRHDEESVTNAQRVVDYPTSELQLGPNRKQETHQQYPWRYVICTEQSSADEDGQRRKWKDVVKLSKLLELIIMSIRMHREIEQVLAKSWNMMNTKMTNRLLNSD
ncbi:hypothetical protein PRIPAC_90120 [Pristionchus pacificus]|uniref:Uncharacterized protein n=1 Tax=Pristionchus pacificus TaxID=54126 RepID=A0A2A6CXE1_PRIPA|nr:hypothetical protein PRIPAC_90120 [Pristionchus pacificus]|eukprot:PDM82845.1 hypothetical protein PRIPAC_37238 [Pristionchus pacificus]